MTHDWKPTSDGSHRCGTCSVSWIDGIGYECSGTQAAQLPRKSATPEPRPWQAANLPPLIFDASRLTAEDRADMYAELRKPGAVVFVSDTYLDLSEKENRDALRAEATRLESNAFFDGAKAAHHKRRERASLGHEWGLHLAIDACLKCELTAHDIAEDKKFERLTCDEVKAEKAEQRILSSAMSFAPHDGDMMARAMLGNRGRI